MGPASDTTLASGLAPVSDVGLASVPPASVPGPPGLGVQAKSNGEANRVMTIRFFMVCPERTYTISVSPDCNKTTLLAS